MTLPRSCLLKLYNLGMAMAHVLTPLAPKKSNALRFAIDEVKISGDLLRINFGESFLRVQLRIQLGITWYSKTQDYMARSKPFLARAPGCSMVIHCEFLS